MEVGLKKSGMDLREGSIEVTEVGSKLPLAEKGKWVVNDA